MFINFTATTVQQPGAKLPYSKAKQRGIFISGLPNGLQLKHPSSYGCRQLKSILDNKINLKIHGLFHMCRFEFMSSSTFIYTVPDVTIQINNDHTHLDQHDQEDVPDTHNSFDQLEHTHDSK